MPRGRHRHSPPLHRLLPPSAIAGVSLVCALGPWVFTAPALLRSLAAAAAVTAIGGAFVMRRWDAQAGRQVADLTRARASDEWRFEERVAELESDLEESRELRVRLEQKLRAKRTELAGLRNEHAALLRRYATAETERASALEGRRLLEIEAAPDTRALPAAPVAPAAPAAPTAPVAPGASGAVTAPASGAGASGAATVPASGVVASGAATAPASGVAASGVATAPGSAAVAVSGTSAAPAVSAVAEDAAAEETGKPAGVAPAVFSPEGSQLFRAAGAALARLAKDEEPAPGTAAEQAPEPADAAGAEPTAEPSDAADADAEPAADAADDVSAEPSDDASAEPSDDASAETAAEASGDAAPAAPETPTGPNGGPTTGPNGGPTTGPTGGPSGGAPAEATAAPGTDIDAEVSPARGDDAAEAAEGRPETADGHEPTAAAPAEEPAGRAGEAADGAVPQAGGRPAQRPAGHFTVPTAVAVVPPAPVRRPAVEGGFDFFGTKKGAPPAALEAVQNEDLADVVGQEALALHKAEAESQYRPADAGTHAVGQVIDLTAHDETEQIDVQNLRSAAS
ncbi:hypothetical protein [Streptomyces sp. BBFR115]|uniref:hypothetical protein n=1 Tax=Streptomyces sp. BBFR115 TaxID=3448173 RepID=UPI003F768726